MAEANCGCGFSNSKEKALQENQAACPAVVHETICVQAAVTITPAVTAHAAESVCVGDPFFGVCPGTPSPSNKCSFMVSQNVCVQIPLTFSAHAAAGPTKIICGTPLAGPCPGVSGCTLSIGYYKNHPEVTNALITQAGGSIILGVDSTGASYTVTTANANAVLSFQTPSPPAPSSNPFAQQYKQLYAQLLAANLNVIGGATCDYATVAITNANTFLQTSQAGVGKAGAPLVQEPLEEFNTGTALGCPEHCP
jgi:hypothetical protein